MPNLNKPCTITCVDFNVNAMDKKHFENESFIEFLDRPKPKWASCRWLNVSGLSWDVVQAIGNKKNLHKLALEDVMTMNNRVKADWYPNVWHIKYNRGKDPANMSSTRILSSPFRSSSSLSTTTTTRPILAAARIRGTHSSVCGIRSWNTGEAGGRSKK